MRAVLRVGYVDMYRNVGGVMGVCGNVQEVLRKRESQGYGRDV